MPTALNLGPSLKSGNVALLLRILWPGLGQMYLGLTKRGTPYVVANAIGLVLGVLTLILIPISLIIWVVTLVMTVGKINDETIAVNAAIRAGVPVQDV